MKQIPPIIKKIAKIYGFKIKSFPGLGCYTIYNQEQHCEFLWDSRDGEDLFFKNLKDHFEEIGAQKNG